MKEKIAEIVNEDNIFKNRLSTLFNISTLSLILISFVLIIIQGDRSLVNSLSTLLWLDYFIIIVFTFEYFLRFWTADSIDIKYKGGKGRVKYFFNFYTFVDFLAIFPFYLTLFLSWKVNGVFKILRLLRLFRFIKYFNSFSFITQAIKNKKSELLISLSLVLVLLIIASTFMYYLEHDTQPEAFSSILSTMWWGVATLTTVGYGDIYPVTGLGKLLGGVIAILGVGLFALPAGIIASGFVEEIEKERKEKDLKEKASMIQLAFQRVQFNSLLGFKVQRRFLTLPYLKARLNYTEHDIFEVVRNSVNLRIKWAKSSAAVQNADMLVLENFKPTTTYGEKEERNSKITIVNPIGRGERAVSHFSKTLAQYGGFNVYSNEFYSSGDILPRHKFQFDINKQYSKDSPEGPVAFKDFCRDIGTIKSNNWVFVIRSASNSRKHDIHVLFGGKKGDIRYEDVAKPTVEDRGLIHSLVDKLKNQFQEEDYKVGTHEEFKSTSSNLLHQYIRKSTNSNVVTLFINIDLLTQEKKAYYVFIKKIGDAIAETLNAEK